ncbi:non-canonical (house-cleaning) NTP pyrophosphatase [Neobacillus niacini]|nr:hypothetical protein [Neobacillus niacini]MDQ1002108.1 non-canonical (house-cleaning) NTP pyrophosphatase [Neobacillus niacini]
MDNMSNFQLENKNGGAIGNITMGKIDRKNKSARVGKVLVGDKNKRWLE